MRQPKVGWAALVGVVLVICWLAVFGESQIKAQLSAASGKLSGPQTKNPGNWPYADAYDEVTAAGEFYRVRYEDAHLRLVEVGIIPGAHTKPHGDPYPAVIAMDGALPKVETQWLDPNGRPTHVEQDVSFLLTCCT